MRTVDKFYEHENGCTKQKPKPEVLKADNNLVKHCNSSVKHCAVAHTRVAATRDLRPNIGVKAQAVQAVVTQQEAEKNGGALARTIDKGRDTQTVLMTCQYPCCSASFSSSRASTKDERSPRI